MMRINVSHGRMIMFDPINALYFINLQNALARMCAHSVQQRLIAYDEKESESWMKLQTRSPREGVRTVDIL